jgi:glycosyltransferase involved in cell wall biosynthesis
MKKILFLIHTLRGGGAEKALVDLVNSMNPHKFDITVMTVINSGKYIRELNPNITYKYIFKEFVDNSINNRKTMKSVISNIKLKLYYKYFWKVMSSKMIYKKYIKERYDVEVSFLEGITAKIISSSINKNSKKICWIHTDLTKNKKTKMFFKDKKQEWECYSRFDKIICVSNNVKKCFLKEFSLDDYKKAIVRYNPIDIKTIKNKSTIDYKCVNRLIRDNEKEKVICSIGRLEKLKGYDNLLKAHKKLIDNGISNKLIILGEGSQHKVLQKYINDNNLKNSVKLVGFINNPYPYLKNSDIYVCSSHFEGLNISVCEAIVLGKPVIVTKDTGLEDIIGSNNEHGIIVNSNVDGLYSGMKEMLNNENMYLNYIKESIKLTPIFELKKNVRKIEKIFG